MGRWLNKEDYAKRARRIVKLKDVYRLSFSQIARRMSVDPGVIERCYYQQKARE